MRIIITSLPDYDFSPKEIAELKHSVFTSKSGFSEYYIITHNDGIFHLLRDEFEDLSDFCGNPYSPTHKEIEILEMLYPGIKWIS